MSELAVVRVLNVSECWESEREVKGSVPVVDHWAALDVEGGQLFVRFDPAKVDVPVGWSGRAVISCYTRQYSWVDNQGKQRRTNYLSPSVVQSFEKGYKHPSLEDVVSSIKK